MIRIDFFAGQSIILPPFRKPLALNYIAGEWSHFALSLFSPHVCISAI